VDALWPDLVLFGEWCGAVHSVGYDRLPDWFLGFDVYDREPGRFWDTPRRDALLADLQLSAVPQLAAGRFTVSALQCLLDGSRVGGAPMNGVVMRCEADGWTTAGAKLARATFTQQIAKHWSRSSLCRNAIAR
jgi:hypothetical protein